MQLGLDNVLYMADSEETCRTYTKALNNSGAHTIPSIAWIIICLRVCRLSDKHHDSIMALKWKILSSTILYKSLSLSVALSMQLSMSLLTPRPSSYRGVMIQFVGGRLSTIQITYAQLGNQIFWCKPKNNI